MILMWILLRFISVISTLCMWINICGNVQIYEYITTEYMFLMYILASENINLNIIVYLGKRMAKKMRTWWEAMTCKKSRSWLVSLQDIYYQLWMSFIKLIIYRRSNTISTTTLFPVVQPHICGCNRSKPMFVK